MRSMTRVTRVCESSSGHSAHHHKETFSRRVVAGERNVRDYLLPESRRFPFDIQMGCEREPEIVGVGGQVASRDRDNRKQYGPLFLSSCSLLHHLH